MTPTLRDVLGHLGAGLILLCALAATPWAAFGLPARFPVAAVAVYATAVPLILAVLPKRLPGDRFGPANAVTLARLAATAVLTAALALPTHDLAQPPLAWTLCALAVTAFAMDGLDGWIARRRNVASPFGARFDMELDAFVTLVLAALAWRMETAGVWVLAAGAARYVYVAAGWLWPPLRRPLPPSQRRRIICAVTVGTLSVLPAPVLPPLLAASAAAAATLALLGSFAADMVRARG